MIIYNVARVSPMFKPTTAGTDMPDMDMGMSRIQMMSSVSVPVVSVSVYPAGFTYPCQTLMIANNIIYFKEGKTKNDRHTETGADDSMDSA